MQIIQFIKVKRNILFKLLQAVSGAAFLYYILIKFLFIATLHLNEAFYNNFKTIFVKPVFLVIHHIALFLCYFHLLNGVRLLLLCNSKYIDEDSDLQWIVIICSFLLSAIHIFYPVLT